MVTSRIAAGSSTGRSLDHSARFSVGAQVRAKKINPASHTRLPRYARGKLGSIERVHGGHVFPDTNAMLAGEHPQYLYSVRFSARELWGETSSPRDAVYLDLWEEYLEPFGAS
jgi:nitrile hydratase